MTMQVTVTLRDEIYKQAEHLAGLTGRRVQDVLSRMLDISLAQVMEPEITGPVESLPDADVLALTRIRMQPRLNTRMSALLDRQQAGELDALEQHELSLLLNHYQEGTLRKAQALAEAVRRGLHPPLEP
jgi:hypothetical protein